MISTDFVYDGQSLSSYGFIICDFESGDGVNEIDIGSVLTFNKTPMNNGKYHALTGSNYEQCFGITFDICKDPDLFEGDQRIINESEYTSIVKWLNRKDFHSFNFINDSPSCYFDASFNISKLIINGELYGIRLIMETNRPFGYGSLVTVTKTYNSTNTSYIIENKSQELGYTYPTIKVKCTQAGNVTITNTTTQNTVVINNLSVNEEVEINGLAQTIKTSKTSHKIADDFNYEFLPLQNSINDSNNVIEATPCKLTISYNPIIKSIKL